MERPEGAKSEAEGLRGVVFLWKECSPPHLIRGLGSTVSSCRGIRGKALSP